MTYLKKDPAVALVEPTLSEMIDSAKRDVAEEVLRKSHGLSRKSYAEGGMVMQGTTGNLDASNGMDEMGVAQPVQYPAAGR